ncbi:MAG: hypothetical protein WB679_05385 [Terracidiphilus sp.]
MSAARQESVPGILADFVAGIPADWPRASPLFGWRVDENNVGQITWIGGEENRDRLTKAQHRAVLAEDEMPAEIDAWIASATEGNGEVPAAALEVLRIRLPRGNAALARKSVAETSITGKSGKLVALRAEQSELPDGSKPVQIAERYFFNESRTALYTKAGGYFQPVNFSPKPIRMTRVFEPEEPEPGRRAEQLEYELELNTKGGTCRATINLKEMKEGKELAAALGGAAIPLSGTKLSEQLGIILEQREQFAVPVVRIPASTGNSRDPQSGQARFVLPGRDRQYVLMSNGMRLVNAAGVSEAAPLPPSYKEIETLLDAELADSKGRLALARGYAYRGLVASFVPIGTALALVTERHVAVRDDKGTGAGKSVTAAWLHGGLDEVRFDCVPDFRFGLDLSPAGLNARLMKRNDTTVFGDDFRYSEHGPQSERAHINLHVDNLTRTSVSGGELHQKAKRDGSARQGAILRCATVMTGERFDPTRSLLRRLLLFRYRQTEIDWKSIIARWDELQRHHRAITAAIIRLVLEMRETLDGEARLLTRIHDFDEQAAEAVLADLRMRYPAEPEELLGSVARNYAKAIAGLMWADWALRDAEEKHVRVGWGAVFKLAAAQIGEMTDAAGLEFDAQFYADAMGHDYYRGAILLSANGRSLADTADTDDLIDKGYRLARIGTTYEPVGVRARWLDKDGYERWPTTGMLDAARSEAAARKLQFPFDIKTLPPELVRLGIAIPNAKGDAVHYERVGGHVNPRHTLKIPYREDAKTPDTADTADTASKIPAILRPSSPSGCVGSKTPPDTADTSSIVVDNHADTTLADVSAVSGGYSAPDTDTARQKTLVCAASGRAVSAVSAVSGVSDVPIEGDIPPPASEADYGAPEGQSEEVAFVAGPEDDPLAEGREATDTQQASVVDGLDASAVPAGKPEARAFDGRAANPLSSAPGEAAARITPGRAHHSPLLGVLFSGGLLVVNAITGEISSFDPRGITPETCNYGALAGLIVHHGLREIWVWPDYASAAGVYPRHRKDMPEGWKPFMEFSHPFSGGVTPEGWRSKRRAGTIAPWTEIEGPGGTVAAIVLPSLGLSGGAAHLLTATGPRVLLEVLSAIRRAFELYFTVNPITMLYRLLRREVDPAWLHIPSLPDGMPKELLGYGLATRGIVWRRPLEADERAPDRHIIGLDATTQFLAQYSSLMVGTGSPYFDPDIREFDPNKVGWYEASVTLPSGWDPLLPDPRGKLLKGKHWYHNERLKLVLELGCKVDITRACLFPERHRIFEKAYHRLRAGIGALSTAAGRNPFPPEKKYPFPEIGSISREAAGLALTIGKMMYSAANGGMSTIREAVDGKRSQAIRHPHAAQGVQELARCNQYRTIMSAGIRPFATRADAFYFSSPLSDAQAAVGGDSKLLLDGRPGHFRPIDEICGFPIEKWPGAGRPGGPRPSDFDWLKSRG